MVTTRMRGLRLIVSLALVAGSAGSADAESLPVVTARLMAPDPLSGGGSNGKGRPTNPGPLRLVAAFNVKPSWSVQVPVSLDALITENDDELLVDAIGDGPLRLGLVNTPRYKIVSAVFDEVEPSGVVVAPTPSQSDGTGAQLAKVHAKTQSRALGENFSIVLTLSPVAASDDPAHGGSPDTRALTPDPEPPASEMAKGMGLLKVVWTACRARQCIPGEASLLFELPGDG